MIRQHGCRVPASVPTVFDPANGEHLIWALEDPISALAQGGEHDQLPTPRLRALIFSRSSFTPLLPSSRPSPTSSGNLCSLATCRRGHLPARAIIASGTSRRHVSVNSRRRLRPNSYHSFRSYSSRHRRTGRSWLLPCDTHSSTRRRAMTSSSRLSLSTFCH